jgi:hypothetical protein
MSTTEEALDYDPEQVIAHSKDDDGSKPFKLNSHKRVDSRELSQVGAQFRLPTKQTSFPRPPYIDICHDEVAHTLKHSTTGDLGHVPTNTQEQRPADQVRFKDGSPLVPYSDSPLGSHHYSKEDVAILIYHRDKGKSKTAQESMNLSLFCPNHPTSLCYMSIPYIQLFPMKLHSMIPVSIACPTRSNPS